MPMQDTINEIYRMRQEADDRERQELADKIKECDLNLLASAKDKSELDKEFRAVYLQRGELLKQYQQYREKYGKKAAEQLRDQMEEARRAYVEQYEAKGLLKSQNGQINELNKQLSEMDVTANVHEIMDIKRRILDELYKFPAVELLDVLLGLLKTQNKDLKVKVEELTRENNNAKKEQKKAEDELEAVEKKQAEQWVRMLLCVISTLTLSTTGAQKVAQKDDSVKPMKVYY